jgi:hypothetical protein
MYWRVRRLSIKELAERYWVNLALIVSLGLNFMLWVPRPDPNKGIPKEVKANYEQFVRTVTAHLLDSSYISYKDSTAQLLSSGELTRQVIDWMRKNELIGKSNDDIDQTAKSLYDQRQVAAIKIDQVNVTEPTANQPLVTADVTGQVAIHSAADNGPTNPVSFHFLFFMDLRHNADKTLINGPDGRPMPEVVGFKEIQGNAAQ